MKKWLILGAITIVLLAISELSFFQTILHPSYLVTVIFFSVQALVLFRIDSLIREEWKVHASLVKIIIRFLSSAVFILVMIYQYEEPFDLVVQFIIIYLIYMVFEIGVALTNLRRN